MDSIMEQSNFSLNHTTQFRGLGEMYQRQMDIYNETHIDLGKTVNLVQFSPFDNSFDILAIACNEHVSIFQVVVDADTGDFGYEMIHEYINGSKCTAIAFSPRTNFSKPINKSLSLAVAGDDFSIMFLNQIFNDGDENQADKNVEQQCLTGHSDYINDMQFEPNSGNCLATASDDCTCCIWSFDETQQKIKFEMKIILSSPGINVKWHASEHNKVSLLKKNCQFIYFCLYTNSCLLRKSKASFGFTTPATA